MKRQRHVVYRRSAILSKEDYSTDEDNNERTCTQNGRGDMKMDGKNRWLRPQASSYGPPLDRRTRQYTTQAHRYNSRYRQR